MVESEYVWEISVTVHCVTLAKLCACTIVVSVSLIYSKLSSDNYNSVNI